MNKYTKILTLMGATFLAVSCQDDFEMRHPLAQPGDDILFGAKAYFENGNTNSGQVRTEYGDIVGNQIEVRWANGDRLDISCPDAVGAANSVAEYMVSGFNHGTNSATADTSNAQVLTKTGPAGLQWGVEKDEYTFYAVYPSLGQIKEHLQGVLSEQEINKLSVNKNGKLNGYLPTIQDPIAIPDHKVQKGGKNGYVINPDMSLAYMVAKQDVDYGTPVSMNFSSIVTALEFQIVAGAVTGTQQNITITGLALADANGSDICGPFSYDYNTGAYSTPDSGAVSGHSQIHMDFGAGFTVAAGEFVDATFFLLPKANADVTNDYYKNLALTVFYKVAGSSQVKTARMTQGVKPRTKTYIKNVTLPSINNVNASSWWSAIPPATLFSQVSIPVAGNVFATPTYSSSEYRQEQTKTIADLWKMGVRGFELCCQTTCDASLGQSPEKMLQESLGSEAIVVAEDFTSKTFDSAVQELITLHTQPGYENEPLILLCTYASKNDGYNPYSYTANLMNYFASLSDTVRNKMVQITSNTTAADLRGGIAVVVRPGNDLRWAYETQNYTAGTGNRYKVLTNPYTILGITTTYPQEGLTAKIPSHLKENENFPKAGKDMLDKVMFIADWGNSSYDMWNRRYGNKYAMEATSYDKLDETRKSHIHTIYNNGNELLKVENFLYGTNKEYNASSYTWSGDADDNNFDYFGQGYTAPWNTTIPEFNFEHNLNTSETDKAFVQEWQRVVKEDIDSTRIGQDRDWLFAYYNERSAWVSWKSSLDEKKEAIKDLFNKSVMTKGGSTTNDLYINVLSGYYATTAHTPSITPIIENVKNNNGTISISNQGKGGDYRGLAKDLNEYVYNLLTETPNGNDDSKDRLKQQGPWGLVMMNHIGTDGDNGYSTKLVDLIMMNNFRFPLAVATNKEEDTPPVVTPPVTPPDPNTPNKPE